MPSRALRRACPSVGTTSMPSMDGMPASRETRANCHARSGLRLKRFLARCRSARAKRVASQRDAWFLLARFISTADLDRYESVAVDVLSSADPHYELSPEERWYAPLKGVRPPFSDYLRKGLGEMLILLVLFGNRASSVTNT